MFNKPKRLSSTQSFLTGTQVLILIREYLPSPKPGTEPSGAAPKSAGRGRKCHFYPNRWTDLPRAFYSVQIEFGAGFSDTPGQRRPRAPCYRALCWCICCCSVNDHSSVEGVKRQVCLSHPGRIIRLLLLRAQPRPMLVKAASEGRHRRVSVAQTVQFTLHGFCAVNRYYRKSGGETR